jgi:hypothetical protein
MIESICVDAVTLHLTREIPKLLEWCALCRNDNDDYDLVAYQKSHSGLAQPSECCADSCRALEPPKMTLLMTYQV